jgi:hypothetical protein
MTTAQKIRFLREMLAELEAQAEAAETGAKPAPCTVDEVTAQRLKRRARRALEKHGLG